MDGHMGEQRVVHCYDVATRRIVCGVANQARSTKHASGVTCAACRELLLGAPRAVARFGSAGDTAHGG